VSVIVSLSQQGVELPPQASPARILERLALGISLLDDPAALAARIEAIRGEGHFRPELYAVS